MSSQPVPPATPWGRADQLAVVAVVGAGLVLLGAGYWGVSGTRVLDDQVSAARLAAAGVLLTQVGFGLAVIRGRRALGRRLGVTLAVEGPAGPGAADAAPAARAPAGLVAATDMTRYHRERCAFVAGKAVAVATAAEHERAGRHPCGVCRP